MQNKKKNTPPKKRPLLGGEESLADLEAHAELAHEDMDPIYPFQPIEGEKPKARKKRKSR